MSVAGRETSEEEVFGSVEGQGWIIPGDSCRDAVGI